MAHERRYPPGVDCLGVGKYGVQVVARRTTTHGPGMVGDIENIISGTWNRGLDTTSSASVTAQLTPGCCEVISKIDPLRHELEIWRERDMVWAGPVTEFVVDQEAGTIVISARDLSEWFQLRAFKHTMKPDDIDLSEIFRGYAEYAMGRGLPEWGEFFTGDPGPRPQPDGRVLAARPPDPPLYTDDIGLDLIVTPTGITGSRTIYKGELKVVYSELEELAQTGVDFTVLNREMYVSGGEVSDTADGDAIQMPGYLADDDFVTAPRLRKTSEGMASEVLTRANGFRSRIGGPFDDGIEITRVLDEYSIEDQVSADAAAQGYFDRGKVPLIYIEGQGALSKECPLSVTQLVPGTRVRTAFKAGGCVNFSSPLRLDAVSASWDGQGEQIMPTLQPLGAAGADARGTGG